MDGNAHTNTPVTLVKGLQFIRRFLCAGVMLMMELIQITYTLSIYRLHPSEAQ